jgi:hypothetical protein
MLPSGALRFSSMISHASRRPILTATACFLFVALWLAGGSLMGKSSIGPDTLVDAQRLYNDKSPPSLPSYNDFSPISHDMPRDWLFARGLHAGRIDSWNPHIGLGHPLWAEQGGPFFPLKLVFYLAPSVASYNLYRILRLVFAALGTFLIVWRRGRSFGAALAGGLALEVSGSMLGLMPFSGAAEYCLPWAVLAAEELGRSAGPRSAILAALVLGTLGNVGHPTTESVVMIGFAIAFAFSAAKNPRAFGWGALAGILGLMLSTPVILPLVELNSAGESYKTTAGGERWWQHHLTWYRTMLATALFAPRALVADRAQFGLAFPYAYAPSFGWGFGTLAILGTLRRKQDFTALAIMAVGVVLATTDWLHGLPGLRYVWPEYAWPLVILGASLYVAQGWEELAGGKRRWRALIAFAIPVVFAWTHRLDARLAETVHHSTRASVWEPPLVALACFLSWMLFPKVRQFAAPLILIVFVVEQARTFAPALAEPPSKVLSAAPAKPLQLLMDHPGRFQATDFWSVATPATPELWGLSDVAQICPFPVKRYKEFSVASSPRGVTPTMFKINEQSRALLDLASLNFLVTPYGIGANFEGDSLLPLETSLPTVVIYRNAGALPRARIVHQARAVANEAAALDWVRSVARERRHAKELGLDRQVIVELRGEEMPPLGSDGDDEAQIIDADNPQRMTIRARLKSPGLLVVADTIYPGWVAEVDGARAPLYAADLLFRAVPVPAGDHQIVLRYRPVKLWLGLFLAFIAGLVLITLGRLRPRTASGRTEPPRGASS